MAQTRDRPKLQWSQTRNRNLWWLQNRDWNSWSFQKRNQKMKSWKGKTTHKFKKLHFEQSYVTEKMTGGHLTEIHLIEIVFFSVDLNFHNQLTEFFDTFW